MDYLILLSTLYVACLAAGALALILYLLEKKIMQYKDSLRIVGQYFGAALACTSVVVLTTTLIIPVLLLSLSYALMEKLTNELKYGKEEGLNIDYCLHPVTLFMSAVDLFRPATAKARLVALFKKSDPSDIEPIAVRSGARSSADEGGLNVETVVTNTDNPELNAEAGEQQEGTSKDAA